ncbi:hypothetical protein EVAR_62520_1 [Eumeta japonica]|uniref:Uncharacterized protein n=1 Tax=Eumeta variegata TaxID=151549 RepID=A0A4C1ZHD8_EUMVA|nr:hypothetical protein EVAR_62520_1 [Eumeta japonica]
MHISFISGGDRLRRSVRAVRRRAADAPLPAARPISKELLVRLHTKMGRFERYNSKLTEHRREITASAVVLRSTSESSGGVLRLHHPIISSIIPSPSPSAYYPLRQISYPHPKGSRRTDDSSRLAGVHGRP